MALGGIVPAEELEHAAEQRTLPFSRVRFGLNGSLSEEKGPDLSKIKPYVQAIVLGGQLELLVNSVLQLDSLELRGLFYTYALPLVVEAAEREQVLWLVRSRLLPGPSVPSINNAMRNKSDFHFPAIDAVLEATAARGLLDAEVFAAVAAVCPQGTLCTARARVSAARALTRASDASQLDFLLPLPPAFQIVELVDPQSRLRRPYRETLLRAPLPFSDDDRAYIVWLAGRQAWDHLALGSTDAGSRNMYWSDVDEAVREGLERASGEAVNYILAFIVNLRWNDAVPAEVLDRAQALLDRQVVASVDFTLPVVRLAKFKRFAKGEVAKLQCASLAELEPDALDIRLDELAQQSVRCRREAQQRSRQRRALESLERVREASGFFGDEGFLQAFASLRVADLPIAQVARARQDLFTIFGKAMCQPVDGPADFVTGSIDRKELAAALRVLDRSRAENPDVTAWMQRITSESPCEQWATVDDGAREEAAVLARAITFEIIDWLDSGQPEEALKRMRQLSGTSNGPVTEVQRGEVGIEHFAAWFQDRSYASDVLFITHADPSRFRLMRRAALYRLASCELAYGLKQRADQLGALAGRSGQLVRQHAAPGDAMHSIRAEAEYHALRADWRRATSSCDRCDAWDALQVASDLILPLARHQRRLEAPKPTYCEAVNESLFDQIFSSQEKIEKEAADEALRRAASAAEITKQTLVNQD